MAWMSSPVFSRSFQLTFIFTILFLLSACTSSDNSSSSEQAQNKSALQGETVVLSASDVTNDSVLTNGSSGIELTFEWSIISRPANSNAELSTPGDLEPAFVADQPGEYVIGLIIRNGTEELLNTTIVVVVEPSDSSDPTDPVGPTDPTDPTDPVEPPPTDPTDPVVPQKPETHISSTDNCLSCHDANTWVVVVVDHTQVVGECVGCHSNMPDITHPFPVTSDCSACHETTTWATTTVDHNAVTGTCVSCHDGQTASGKSGNHIPTTNECDACHDSGTYWTPVMTSNVDHTQVMGECINCHDSPLPVGPPHPINTTNNCAACHSTTAWTPVSVDHLEVIGTCLSCHDGVIATGMSDTHIQTTLGCDSCHNTQNWTTMPIDHSGFENNCIICHDGESASGKSDTHINTTDECDACHLLAPAHWAPVTSSAVDHSQVIGICASCHDNVIASGKSYTHVPTTEQCNVCHGTRQWIPAAVDHSTFENNCIYCHDGVAASGKSDLHISSTDVCDACHAPFPAQWTPVANTGVDHTQVIGTCSSCHQLPAGHVETTDECDACHSPPLWLPVLVPHDLWVVDNNNDHISKLNLSDGTTQFQFVAPGGNSSEDSSHGLAWDGEFFWTFHINSSRLYKVDTSGVIVNFIEFPQQLLGLEYVDGTLWGVGGNSVVAINPVDGSFNSIPSPVGAPQAIAFDGVRLWVVGNTANDEIYTIEPNSGASEYKFNSPDLCPSGLEYYRDQLYIIGCGGLTIIDPVTGDTIRNLPTSTIGYGTDLTFVPDSVSSGNNTPIPPVANAGEDHTTLIGDPVTLYGGDSYDPDGDSLTYLWQITSYPIGSTAQLNNTSVVSPTFIPDIPGAYIVSLIVNDGVLHSEADTTFVYATVASSCQSTANCGAGSFCEKPVGACDSAGTCAQLPPACSQIHVPVCGCDGQTYSNACIAALSGVSVAYNGEC